MDTPGPQDLYQVGTVCVMHKAIRMPKDNLLLFCEGIARIRTREYTAKEPFLRARVERIPEIEPHDHSRGGGAAAERGRPLSADRGGLAQPLRRSPTTRRPNHGIRTLADFVAGNLPVLSQAERQKLLEQNDAARA